MSLYGGPNPLLEYAQKRGFLEVIPFPKSGVPVLRIHKPAELGVFLQEIVEETDSEAERLFAQDVLSQMNEIRENLTEIAEKTRQEMKEKYGPDVELVQDEQMLQLIPKGFSTELMKRKATFSDEEFKEFKKKLEHCDTPEQFLATFFK